jgi:hypothetical protein
MQIKTCKASSVTMFLQVQKVVYVMTNEYFLHRQASYNLIFYSLIVYMLYKIERTANKTHFNLSNLHIKSHSLRIITRTQWIT